MNLDNYLSETIAMDREMKRRNEQEFIELVKMIRLQLMLLREQDHVTELEAAD
jgi:hypothetical protein